MVLNANAERLVWHRAAQIYGSGLGQLLDAAIGSFKRSPGLHGLARLYVQGIGEAGLRALVISLKHRRNVWFYPLPAGVEIRHELRWHLFYVLRRQMIMDGHITDVMVDDHIGADLGL